MLTQSTNVTDNQADRRTDGILKAMPRYARM